MITLTHFHEELEFIIHPRNIENPRPHASGGCVFTDKMSREEFHVIETVAEIYGDAFAGKNEIRAA